MNRFSADYGKEWNLKEIGAYCTKLKQRTAADAWIMGRLLFLAKEKAKKKNASFTKWKREHKFSNATVSRHIRLYKHFSSDKDRERLCTIGIMEGLRQAGVVAHQSGSAQESVATARRAKVAAKTSTASPTPQDVEFPWAIDNGPEAEECRKTMDREYADYAEKQWAKSGSLREVCRSEMPWQMDNLLQSAKLALERKSETRNAWPEDCAERTKLLLIINELLQCLPRLAESLADRTPAQKSKVNKRRKPAKKKNVAT